MKYEPLETVGEYVKGPCVLLQTTHILLLISMCDRQGQHDERHHCGAIDSFCLHLLGSQSKRALCVVLHTL